MLERDVVAAIKRYLASLGSDVFFWKEHGGPYGTSGVPDIICCYWLAPGAHFYPCDGANDIGNAFVLSGNSHHDVIFINTPRESQPNLCDSSVYDGGAIDQGAGQIPIIVTQCDAYAAAADSVHSTAMTKDTVSEVCIDLVTTNETGVYLTRIGAGSDREILFSQKDS